VAGLLGIAVVGVAVAGTGGGLDVTGFRTGMAVVAGLLVAGGLLGLIGIRNPALADGEQPVLSSRA
jgi:hypothetical protein